SLPSVSIGRPQMLVSPIPATAATPGNVWPNPVPPNQAIYASCGWVAQKPWVRVTFDPVAVFSNVHVTVSPAFSVMLAVAVARSPVPLLVPPALTVQLVLPGDPTPVSTHDEPSPRSSVTE